MMTYGDTLHDLNKANQQKSITKDQQNCLDFVRIEHKLTYVWYYTEKFSKEMRR